MRLNIKYIKSVFQPVYFCHLGNIPKTLNSNILSMMRFNTCVQAHQQIVLIHWLITQLSLHWKALPQTILDRCILHWCRLGFSSQNILKDMEQPFQRISLKNYLHWKTCDVWFGRLQFCMELKCVGRVHYLQTSISVTSYLVLRNCLR